MNQKKQVSKILTLMLALGLFATPLLAEDDSMFCEYNTDCAKAGAEENCYYSLGAYNRLVKKGRVSSGKEKLFQNKMIGDLVYTANSAAGEESSAKNSSTEEQKIIEIVISFAQANCKMASPSAGTESKKPAGFKTQHDFHKPKTAK